MYRKTFALFILALSAVQPCYGQIYKWVDEDGVTHFGATRPAYTDSRKMDLKNPHRQTAQDTLQNQSRQSPTVNTNIQKQHTIESLAAKTRKLNCDKTVRSAEDHIAVKMAVNKKNHFSGYISKAAFQRSEQVLVHIKKHLSIPNCNAPDSNEELFYQCVNHNVNNLIECGRKHQFGYQLAPQ